jgi:MFS family permease
MLTYHLQVVLHYSPLRAGLAFLPMVAANSASGYAIGARLMPRVSARVLIPAGLVVAASGLALLSQLNPASGYLTTIMPAEVLVGVGMGSVFPPAFGLATSGVAQRDAGVAAAVANTAAQVGGSLGTAGLNTIAITATAGYLATRRPSATTGVAGLVHGYATATAWAAVLLAGAALLAAVVIPTRRQAPSTSKEG